MKAIARSVHSASIVHAVPGFNVQNPAPQVSRVAQSSLSEQAVKGSVVHTPWSEKEAVTGGVVFPRN